MTADNLYGHVMRIRKENCPRKMISFILNYRRKKRRAKTSWRKGTEVAMRKRESNEGDWEDRREWRL